MLRIIAGTYRSRKINVPESGTVPTKDRVREALFSSLGEAVNGARVLDAFAGSGALGIEALSRGASYCLFCDIASARLIQENLKSLGENKGDVYAGNVLDALRKESDPFDIVFLDPPYAEKELYHQVLTLLEERNLLKGETRIVLEYEGDCPIDTASYAYAREKKYGYTKVLMLRKE